MPEPTVADARAARHVTWWRRLYLVSVAVGLAAWVSVSVAVSQAAGLLVALPVAAVLVLMGRKAHFEDVVSNARRQEAAALTAAVRSWRGQAYLLLIVVTTMATLALGAYLVWVGLYAVAALTLVVGALATWRLMSSLLRFLAARDAVRHADPGVGPRSAP